MDTLKQVALTLVAFAVGGVVGACLMYLRLAPELAAKEQELQNAKAMVDKLEHQVTILNSTSGLMNRQNEALRDEIDALNNAAAMPLAVDAQPPGQATTPEAGDEFGALLSALGEAAAQAPSRPLRPAETQAPGTETDDWSRLSGEERQARRSEFMTQMRQRTSEMVEAEVAKTNDPAVRQRLEALREQSDYMLELSQQLRETKDEQQRAELQQEFEAARGDVGALVQEQQDHMLRQVAAQYGITDPAQQSAFAQSLRETQASPLFRAPVLTWGVGAARGRGVE